MRAAMSPTELVRSTFSLLAASVLAMGPVSPLDAQERAKKKAGITSATTTAVPATVVTPGSVGRTPPGSSDLVALRTTSDLVIENLGFTGKGEIRFELRNRGEVPINPPTPPITDEYGNTIIEGLPLDKRIQVNVYLDDLIADRFYEARLGAKESKTFTRRIIPDSRRPKCAQRMVLQTVIDSANVIVELTETNNVTSLTAVRPCPDLAVASIKKKFNDLRGTEYVARVTLVNQGNAPVESFRYQVFARVNAQGSTLAGEGGPLAPGQTMEVTYGGSFGSASAKDTMWVSAKVDRSGVDEEGSIDELDETNNLMEKMLD